MKPSQTETVVIHWFRRDLRLHDNTALDEALKSGFPVLPLFIFDTDILDELETDDPRVSFIYEALRDLDRQLEQTGSGILIRKGRPLEVLTALLGEYHIKGVYLNHDYEPYAIKRDQLAEQLFLQKGIPFMSFKDQVIFEKSEVVKDNGQPYTVFTPYSRKWTDRFSRELPYIRENAAIHPGFLHPAERFPFPSMEALGFRQQGRGFAKPEFIRDRIMEYDKFRDIPSLDATSRLSVHLRFGTVSARELAILGWNLNRTWLSELQWREFFMQILYHFPDVAGKAFKPAYDKVAWRNNQDDFRRWCNGETGYPLVDAGMRELSQTGFMHNRVRMVTASFLTKHLLIDWRWGEAWFARKLMDFELSSNNGNWQWAAGSGCDAAPYFRIFNPAEQARKFDPESIYIRKWVQEYGTHSYPRPMVDHAMARERCLNAYAVVRS